MKKQPVSIWLSRAEGWHDECSSITLSNSPELWQRANLVLMAWSYTAPRDGSYHKCDFKVTYEDGETYEGRFDLVHFSIELPNFSKHVCEFVEFHAGRCPENQLPEHMQNGVYAEWLANEWTQKIEDLNQRRFLTYCNMAVKKFNEKIFDRIYHQMGYKKCTMVRCKMKLNI